MNNIKRIKEIPDEEHIVKTILLVEDDANIGEVLMQAITQETPYFAILAADGFEALNRIKGVKPSLFILDYHLPRMNGLELYDQLHIIVGLEHIPAIMVSARLPRQELKKRNILGINKPLDLDEFLQTIDQLLL
jgi:CheY-like chemotaxis protein